ncbi:MAG: TonB-dependent receptor, partial [Algicola sp.]|nr:TonB-dependent receptor [Algicola sp.]
MKVLSVIKAPFFKALAFKGLASSMVLACLMLTTSVYAQDGDSFNDMSFEDLMNTEMVSSSKFKQDLSEVTASAYIISEEDIAQSGATDLPSLLKMVPGLFIAQTSSSGWSMGIRGFNSVFSNKMLVMIDGRSLFSPLFSGVFWEQLDLFVPDIARIEVIRGVGSTVWGANAVNGIINIITKSTLDNESSQFYFNSGSHTKYDVGLRFGAEITDQSYARVYAKSKDIRANSYDAAGPLDDSWRSNTVCVKWEHFVGRDAFVLSGDYIEQSIKDPGLMTSRVDVNAIPIDNTNANLSFQWQRQMSTDKAFTLSAQIQDSERDSDYYRIEDRMSNIDVDTNYKWQQHQIVVGFGARQHDILFEARRAFAISDGSGQSDTRTRILSAYIQDEWRLHPNHSLILGTKFESHVHTDKASNFNYEADVWLPTLRYRFDISENAKIWAALSRSARIPSIVEHSIQIPLVTLEPNTVNNPSPWVYELFTSGNSEFKKEKLTSIELGFRANIDESNSIDLVAFRNSYDDVRSFSSSGPFCVNSGLRPPNCAENDRVEQHNLFKNGGSLTINGFEASWFSRLSQTLNLTANYAYLN